MWIKWILCLALSSPAWGFKLTADFTNGFYWASLPISITVVDTDDERKGMIEKLSKGAIQDWEFRTGLSLWDFSHSQGSAVSSNIIRWSNQFATETKMDPNSVLAVAIRYTNGPYFARTEIIINGTHPLNSDQEHLFTTLTHELGHTMGLDHSEVGDAVMAPTLQPKYLGLHQDDITAMNAVFEQSQDRQLTGYISPLSYSQTQEPVKSMGCGTVAMNGLSAPAGSSAQGFVSVLGGILITFVRKLLGWFKSRL